MTKPVTGFDAEDIAVDRTGSSFLFESRVAPFPVPVPHPPQVDIQWVAPAEEGDDRLLAHSHARELQGGRRVGLVEPVGDGEIIPRVLPVPLEQLEVEVQKLEKFHETANHLKSMYERAKEMRDRGDFEKAKVVQEDMVEVAASMLAQSKTIK